MKRKRGIEFFRHPAHSEDNNFTYFNGEFPFSWLSTELHEGIFGYLGYKSLSTVSRVCKTWNIFADRAWLQKITRLLGHKYYKDQSDPRSYQQIYRDCFTEKKLQAASMKLVAILMSQQKLFVENGIQGNSFAELVLKKLNLLCKLITNIDKSIQPYAMINFLLNNKIPKIPAIKSILEKGYMSNSNDPEIIKYKDNVSATPRINLPQILITFDDVESIMLLHTSGININFSYYQVTPIMLATWYNCEKAFAVIKEIAGSALYKQGSIDPSFIEPTLESVANCQSYKILPFLDITPESFDQSLINKPRPEYSNSEEFIERLLTYFEAMLSELYTPIIHKLNEKESEHPLCVIFAHFAVNLEEANNDVKLANEFMEEDIRQKIITQPEYDVMKTVEYFIKATWPIPPWLDEMLDILELRLNDENEWETDILVEDAAEDMETFTM